MTDNEIIKSLECCTSDKCTCSECSYEYTKHIKNEEFEVMSNGKFYDEWSCDEWLKCDLLDLINRQKTEIERFKNRQKPTGASGYKIENGKVVFFTNMLGGCRHEYKDLDEIVKTLNELLQECYSKDEIAFALKCKTEDLKTARAEAVKEFVERLEHLKKFRSCMTTSEYELSVTMREIDKLVKEFTGGKADEDK